MRHKTVTKFFIVFCVLLSCMMLAVAYMTVSSYTDYAKDTTSLHSLFVFQHAIDEESLSPEKGTPFDPRPSLQSMVEDSDTVIVGRFNGERSYGYQTFICGVKVIRSIEGDLAEGQTIQVFEPMEISQAKDIAPDLGFDDTQSASRLPDGETQVITCAGESPYLYGKGLMREGSTYLLFLQRKAVPPQLAVPDGTNQYRMYGSSPYARVLLADTTTISVVGNGGITILSFEESAGTDQFVTSARAKEVYEENSKRLVDRFVREIL